MQEETPRQTPKQIQGQTLIWIVRTPTLFMGIAFLQCRRLPNSSQKSSSLTLEIHDPAIRATTSITLFLYCTSRIKSPESMKNKLKKHGYPLTCESALTNVRDAIGIRAICSFSDDVFALARWLCERLEFNVINQKDYISYPKPNGYRSYHLILHLVDGPGGGLFAEIQLRTIAIDFWASLEHQLKYKHEITHEALIRSELKRCADEIASIDLSMQTIRDLIDDNFSNCSERSSSL